MKKTVILFIIPLILCSFCLLSSCCKREEENQNAKEKETMQGYEQITQKEAKEIMEENSDCVVIDARTAEEFSEGHIPGAVNLDYEETEEKAAEVVPEKDTLILIYCRSGRRSKIAAETFVSLGYENVKEFGGIIDWPYEIVKE